jgi:drug/metabolite transporter (DMT)-like permease
LAAVGYLTLFGSIIAFSAYVFLLRRAPASRVSTHAYVNPLIAVSLGVVLAGEPLTISIVTASVVIAAGVALVLSGRQNPPTFRAPSPSKSAYGWIASRPAARS